MQIFGPKGENKGIMKVLMVLIFFLVGWLEDRLDSVPPDFSQLPALRKRLCR